MRGSPIDRTDDTPSEQIDAAEKAAGLQSMHPPLPDKESDFGLWFAIGAGISAATIAVAVAVS